MITSQSCGVRLEYDHYLRTRLTKSISFGLTTVAYNDILCYYNCGGNLKISGWENCGSWVTWVLIETAPKKEVTDILHSMRRTSENHVGYSAPQPEYAYWYDDPVEGIKGSMMEPEVLSKYANDIATIKAENNKHELA